MGDPGADTPEAVLVLEELVWAAHPLTTSDLVRETGLTLRHVLLALRGLLNRGDVVALDGARYALNEVADGGETTAREVGKGTRRAAGPAGGGHRAAGQG